MSYRKYLGRERPLWWTTRSVVDDLRAMARQYEPQRPLALPQPPSPSQIVVSNPLGVESYNAVVQDITLPTHGGTPSREPQKWYDRNQDSFLAERRRTCVGLQMTAVADVVSHAGKNGSSRHQIVPERRRCAFCGKGEAHAYCALCHHYFHDNPRWLPEGEQKLIALPTGKRDRDGAPIYGPMCANTCFHAGHACGRAAAYGGTQRGFIPRTCSVRPNVVVAQRGGGTVSSLSDSGGGTLSPVDASDSIVGEDIQECLIAEAVALVDGGGAAGCDGNKSGSGERSTTEGGAPC